MPQNLRFVFRSLARSPVFTVTAILSLSLGIGANTALFTLANQVLLRVLPVKDPRQVVMLNWRGQFIGGTTRGWQDTFSYPMYRDLAGGDPGVFDGVAARYQDEADVMAGGSAQRASAELVSRNYFEVLGVGSVMGRVLTREDDQPAEAGSPVVLSYAYWRRRFGADPAVLNRVIDVNSRPMTIVGVAERGFPGFDMMSPSDIFIPLRMKTAVTPTWDDRERRDSIWLKIFARLKPGVDRATASAAMAIPFHGALVKDLQSQGRDREFSQRYLRNSLALTDASQGLASLQREFSKPLWVLLAMAGTLLLMTCANIAGLLVTRVAGRRKEIAIRLSLGATKASLIRLLIIESLCIAAFSGAVGLLLANWLSAVLAGMLPIESLGAAIEPGLDGRMLAFTAALSLFTAILFGLIPAIQAARPDVAPALKNESASVSLSSGQTRVRRALVSTQVALSVLLLAGAGLFARSLHNLMAVDTGMNVTRVLSFSIDPSLHRYPPQRCRDLYVQFQDALRNLPAVVSVSGASFAILAGNNWQNGVHVQGYSRQPREAMNPGWNQMLPGFFATMGVPLISGRDFNGRDTVGAPKTVIVNETFVKRFVPSGAPIGLHLGWGESGPMEYEIVGVVKDMKGADLKEKPKPWTYTAALQDKQPSAMTFYVRTTKDPLAVAQSIRGAAHQSDASLPILDMKTLETQIGETHFTDRLFARLSGAFALLAMLLACVGLYGATAFAISRRTQEIGVRLAIGANRADILRLIMREVLLLTGAGVLIGIPLFLIVGKLVEKQIYEVKRPDLAIISIAVVIVTSAVAAAAGYLPARRAAGFDPLQSLRGK